MSKLKVLLLGLSVRFDAEEEPGLGYMTSILREKGYEVMLTCKKERDIDYSKFKEFGPDVVALSIYDDTREAGLRVSRQIRQDNPDAHICIGGYVANSYGTDILAEADFVDSMLKGEGEYTFLELVSRLESKKDLKGIKGLIHRQGGQVIAEEEPELLSDLNALPFPARDVMVDNKLKYALLSTSRGCSGRCSFCERNENWRGIDAEKVVDEIEYVVNTYGMRIFKIIDRSFDDPDIGRMRDIAEAILKRNLSIIYYANFRSGFHKLASPELMNLLRKSGLRSALVGIETANETDMKVYNKNASLEDNTKIVEMLREYGIQVSPGFINFSPYATFDGLSQNIDFLEKYGFANLINVKTFLAVYKGLDIYPRLKKDGLLVQGANGKLTYSFVDERVKGVRDFVVEKYQTWEKQKIIENYKDILYQYNMYFLHNFELNFSGDQFEKERGFLGEYIDANNVTLAELNQSVTRWFRALLELGESGWSYEKACQVSDEILSDEFLNNNDQQLKVNRSKLYRKMMRINPEYGTILTKW